MDELDVCARSDIARVDLGRLVGVRVGRIGNQELAAASTQLGFRFDSDVNRWSGSAPRTLRLGPSEWIVVASPHATRVSEAFAYTLHHVWDLADGYRAWKLCATLGADLLSLGCTLDFDAGSFPAGACTRTLIAQIDAIVFREESALTVIIDTSSAHYFQAWLDDALAGLQ